jgi:MEMO1 family protein
VDAYLAEADIIPPDGVKAIIAPHAGLIYSGPVAAFAYKAVRAQPYAATVLVGPSHFVPFAGVSLWRDGEWETPYGDVPVDAALASALAAATEEIVDLPAAHGREHSLEMQLPFVARVLPETRIVPLAMGEQTRATAFALGDGLARAIGARPRPPDVLLVASTDLSHYQDAHTAFTLDSEVIRAVDAFDVDGLMAMLEREPHHACGGGPMVSVLQAARALGAGHARVVRYADSGDVSGDKTSVVGYMAAVIW